MMDFLAGSVCMGFAVAALFFWRYWNKSGDRLFFALALAFALLTINQGLAAWFGHTDERSVYAYLLRILGFVFILAAIIDKNLSRTAK